jgi:hypothetical protein
VADAPLATSSGRPLNGARPIFLMSVGDSPPGVISIEYSAADALGWRGQKTPWFVSRAYKGPVLVRAARVDRSTPVQFAKLYGQHLRELRFRAGENNAVQGSWRFLASATLFRETGCYSFQIDGMTFSRVVTMQVVERSSP